MELLYGKKVADEILNHLKDEIFDLEKKPGLAVILIGENKASRVYVDLKEKAAKKIGIEFFKYLIPESSSENDVINLIDILNKDDDVDGIIIQLPICEKFDTNKLINRIDPKKDIDGFSEKSELFGIKAVFPYAILKIIQSSKCKINNKKALIIANSAIFGEKMKNVLEGQNLSSDYILSQELSSNLDKIKEADVIVSAVGSPGLLNGEMFKNGTIVIDGGIEKVGEKVLGDVDFASTEEKEGFLTPVPGGVGPVTIACLLENVYFVFKANQNKK